MVVIFNLGLGQGGLFDHRPHHRLGALIQKPVIDEFHQLAGDLRLGGEVHRRIRIFPVADHAEPLKFLALHADPVFGKIPAFLAEFHDRHFVLVTSRGPVFFLDLPFDRQAVTIPARHVIGILAQHLLRPVDDVLQDLVQGMTDMQIAVRVGRAVMEDKLLAPRRLFAQAPVQVHFLPTREDTGFALGQLATHFELGLRQEDGGFIVCRHNSFLSWQGAYSGARLESSGPMLSSRARASCESSPICSLSWDIPSNFFSGRIYSTSATRSSLS